MDSTEEPDATGRLDLNLIRLYVAVFETGSVSRAAERLAMTQPSASYGLGRLRDALGDPLFARRGRAMVPTPLSEQLYEHFRDALSTVDTAIAATQAFDASTSRRVFRVAMSDVGAICLAPPLLERIRSLAPDATLEIAQVAVEDLVDDLASGKLDLAVGNLPLVHPAVRGEALFPERYVCLLSRRHPRIGERLSKDQFVRERHVVVASPFSIHRNIEESLLARGIRRKIALRVPHFGILPAIIPHGDYLVTLPSRLATVFERFSQVRVAELPVVLPSFGIRALWHSRQQSNPANAWLRINAIEVLRSL